MKAAVLSLPRDVSKRPLEIRDHNLGLATFFSVCAPVAFVERTCTLWKANCRHIAMKSFPDTRSLEKLPILARPILWQALASVSHGLAARTEAAGIASMGWKTFVTLRLLPDTA
jgi:hypothetical protein